MKHLVNFATLTPEGLTSARRIDVSVCPHLILVASHYREDGTCRCDDPAASEMKEWGYRWSKKLNRWK